jgi:hypothetical protein
VGDGDAGLGVETEPVVIVVAGADVDLEEGALRVEGAVVLAGPVEVSGGTVQPASSASATTSRTINRIKSRREYVFGEETGCAQSEV